MSIHPCCSGPCCMPELYEMGIKGLVLRPPSMAIAVGDGKIITDPETLKAMWQKESAYED